MLMIKDIQPHTVAYFLLTVCKCWCLLWHCGVYNPPVYFIFNVYFIIQACLFAVVGPSPLQLRWCVGISACMSFFFPLSRRHSDTENRMNYCIAVGKRRIRITERNERGRSGKDSLRRLSVSPLSVLHASSVTMGTVDGCLSFCVSISSPLPPSLPKCYPFAGWKLCTPTGISRKTKWHLACLLSALF